MLGVGAAALALLGCLHGALASGSTARLAAPDPEVLRAILYGEPPSDPMAPSPPGAPPAEEPATGEGGAGLPAEDPEPVAAPVAPGAIPPAEVAADATGGAPRLSEGSLSLGYPAGGTLAEASALPDRGEHFALLPMIRKRGTHFATDEMAALLHRVAGEVAGAFPGAVLRLGNVSFRDGGEIPWSVSHQAGRDADVAFF